uniref:ZnMc domain-containing protein n=1 Tax=Angiostrongylus cantonensis TaxID=6313 RepID=A0A0K0DBZ0_ANGCA
LPKTFIAQLSGSSRCSIVRRIDAGNCGSHSQATLLSKGHSQDDRQIEKICGLSLNIRTTFQKLQSGKLSWVVSSFIAHNLDLRSTIHKAFQLWAKQANHRNLPKVIFRFEEAASQADADINILWAEGAHGDQYETTVRRKISFGPSAILGTLTFQFDGASPRKNILAHTFFPGHSEPLNGDIHFDDAETWETDLSAATNYDRRFFPYVLAHEIGHALGLQHAKKQEAIMYPYYKNTPLDEIKLDLDDKCAINWNYGTRTVPQNKKEATECRFFVT